MAQTPGLTSKLAKGSLLLVLLRVVVRCLGFVSLVVVARVVPPEDIGISALAATVILAFDVFQNMGLSIALIRKRDATADDYNTIWTFGLARGLLKALLIVILAPYAASFFEEPRLTEVLYFLGVMSLFVAASNVGIVDFQKKLLYRQQFQLSVAAQAVYLVTVISAAMILKSYWALILGIAAEQLSRFVLSYLMHSFRPRLAWKPDRSLFAFSFWYWLSGIASFFSTRSDAFIIGRLIGVESLGLYHISQRLAKMTSNEISEPVARALVPGYAILAEDSSSLRHVYLNAISGLIMVGAPLAATLAFIPEPIVRLLFGEQWLTAIPLIRVMAAGALLQILTIQNQVLLFQINREKQVTALAFVRLAILVPAIAIGATYWGLLGVATGVVLTGLVTWTANQTIVSRDIGLSGSQVAGCLLRPISAALATGALLLVLSRHLDAAPTALAGALQLVALLGVGALVYVALILLLWIVAGRPNDLVANLLSKLRRKLPFRSSLSP